MIDYDAPHHVSSFAVSSTGKGCRGENARVYSLKAITSSPESRSKHIVVDSADARGFVHAELRFENLEVGSRHLLRS